MVSLYDYPDLLELVDLSLLPESIKLNNIPNSEAIYWKCDAGHSYPGTISKRRIGRGCVFCTKREVLTGFNDFATHYPHLLKTYATTHNGPADKIIANYNKKIWWKCLQKNHYWSESVKSRELHNFTCAICEGRTIEIGFNDLATVYPHIWSELELEDKESKLSEIKFNSIKHYKWKCEKGHIWATSIKARLNGSICHFCSGLHKTVGENDLLGLYPNIAEEWDSERNNTGPEGIAPGSVKDHWWRCKAFSHSFKMSPKVRTSRNYGCYFCSNRRLLPGFNDLATIFPELELEYSKSLNSKKIFELSKSSFYDAYWICQSCAHTWQEKVRARTIYKTKCPKCFSRHSKSSGELEVLEFVKTLLRPQEIISGDRRLIAPLEIDIYLPALKKGIEYNGHYWHSEEMVIKNKGISAKQYHQNKLKKCYDQKVDLLHLPEEEWLNNRENTKEAIADFLKTPFGWCVYET